MSAFPYMRFYVGDYLGDTRHLSTLEHGAYVLLILAYWQRGKPLPNDDRALAHIAGLQPRQWLKIRSQVLDFFHVSGNEIVHHRIEREIEHMLAKSLKSQGAGRASAERRLNRRPTIPYTIVQKPEGVSAKADTTRAQAPAREGDFFGDEPPDGGDRQGEDDAGPVEHYTAPFETWWAEYPNKIGKRKAALAYEQAFKRLGGAKSGTAKVHAALLAGAKAQVAVWKRKGVVGKYIPHPSTWLSRSSWEDAEVVAEVKRVTGPRAASSQREPHPDDNYLAPPTPKPPPEKRERWRGQIVGYVPVPVDEER